MQRNLKTHGAHCLMPPVEGSAYKQCLHPQHCLRNWPGIEPATLHSAGPHATSRAGEAGTGTEVQATIK